MSILDDDYANAAYIEHAMDFPSRWAAAAATFREQLAEKGQARLDLAYGDTPRRVFDLFLPDADPQGLMIFVHGGYWLKFDKSSWSHLAQGAVSRGWACATPSYDLCPEVSIAQITQQIRCAVVAAAQEVPGPVTLAGHSAGGHLVSRMLAPDMLPADVAARIRHVMPISPVSDLRAITRTSMNADFKLDYDGANAESPVRQPAPSAPVTVVVGGEERPVFLHLAEWQARAWECAHVVVPERHHFDVIDALANPDSDLVRRLT